MSKASSRAEAGAEDWIERLRPWIAAVLTALLHLLILILAMSLSPITLTTPQGAAAGSREQVTEVTFIDQAPPSPEPPRAKPASTAAANRPVKAPPAASRVQSTLVMQAEDPVPPDAASATTPLTPEPVQRPSVSTTAPADAQGEAAQGRASTESPPPPARRRSRTYGQPPGMLPEATAPVNAGLAMSPAVNQGRRNDASSSQANMEVGGYQVYYDLLNEIKLRAWRDQGMTELFLPLPGIRQYMVCPLEVALKRESGACRLVEPNAPELDAIGDAREVINMQRVYRRGEVIWRGPGPYR